MGAPSAALEGLPPPRIAPAGVSRTCWRPSSETEHSCGRRSRKGLSRPCRQQADRQAAGGIRSGRYYKAARSGKPIPPTHPPAHHTPPHPTFIWSPKVSMQKLPSSGIEGVVPLRSSSMQYCISRCSSQEGSAATKKRGAAAGVAGTAVEARK